MLLRGIGCCQSHLLAQSPDPTKGRTADPKIPLAFRLGFAQFAFDQKRPLS